MENMIPTLTEDELRTLKNCIAEKIRVFQDRLDAPDAAPECAPYRKKRLLDLEVLHGKLHTLETDAYVMENPL